MKPLLSMFMKGNEVPLTGNKFKELKIEVTASLLIALHPNLYHIVASNSFNMR